MVRSGPRILAGRHRGRPLRVGRGARPTEGRVREALFNIWRDRVADCRFLDLFAGSGAMGLEAFSRGAKRVTWVEKQGQAVATIRRNLDELATGSDPEKGGEKGELRVLRLDLPAQADRLADPARAGGTTWDIIYADPPYAFDGHRELVGTVAPLLAADGVLAVEHSPRLESSVFDELPASLALEVTDRRVWGDCAVTFLARILGSSEDIP